MSGIDPVTVDRDGSALTVRVSGDGPPMLYLHGLTGLGAIGRAEAPAGYRVATFDQRGHGEARGTWSPPGFAVEEFVADALAVLDALAWERAALGGTSMGSAVALRLALAHPDRVSELALVAPAFGPEPSGAGDIFAAMVAGLRSLPMRALIPVVRARQRERGLPDEATAWLEQWIAHDPLVLATAVEVVSRWMPFPGWEPLATLGIPAALVAWPGDPMHPLPTAQACARVLDAPLRVLGGLAEAVTDPTRVSEAMTAALLDARGSVAREQSA